MIKIINLRKESNTWSELIKKERSAIKIYEKFTVNPKNCIKSRNIIFISKFNL